MHDRPPARDRAAPATAAAERQRARKARKQRAYRQRDHAGKCCVTVEIDADVLDMLCRLHWLDARKADDRRRIGAAIAAMLAAAARGAN
jgi:hypothetical protein